MRIKIGIAVAALGLAALGLFGICGFALRDSHRSSAADIVLQPYAGPQKVVYHITDGDGLFNHHSARVLQSVRNHINAVAKGNLEIRIVLQGEGLDVLLNASHDKALAAAVDTLKADGVHFSICRNTMVGRHVELSDLHGASIEDIVPAGVAEAAMLQGKGYAYLKL